MTPTHLTISRDEGPQQCTIMSFYFLLQFGQSAYLLPICNIEYVSHFLEGQSLPTTQRPLWTWQYMHFIQLLAEMIDSD